MKNILTLFFLITLSARLSAQSGAQSTQSGKITGKLTDVTTKQPVEYATISLLKQGTTTPINGVISDAKGSFAVDHIPNGEYTLNIDFIGYKRNTIEHIIISNTVHTVALGSMVLSPVQNQLKSVEVVGKTPVVENKLDKLVYNAANDLTSQGGVALDVLKKVPMVSVDIDGNVELQGDANIRFLINGKPSSIFGASLADALQSIPASQIKSIEVITSPGAKYDINGTGGIINIILKDSRIQGVNGSVNLSAGTRLENGSFNFNVRRGNFGVNTFFSGNDQLSSTSMNTIDRLSYNNARDTATHLLQKGTNQFVRSGYQSGISFNWSITPKDELTGSFGLNHFSNHSTGVTNQEQQQMVNSGNVFSDILSLRNSNSRSSSNATDWSLSYKKTFNRKDQELDILYTSSSGRNTGNVFQEQDYLNGGYPSSGSMSNNPGKDRQTNISIDYTQPISDKFTIETGAKTVIENLNNTISTDTLLNNGTYVLNPRQTYGFNYNRQVFAYYISANFSLFNGFIEGKAGLRDEYTHTTADFPGANIPGYNIVAPSFVLNHKLDKTQSLKLSYTYRIERPDYGDLNPFYNISDPHNISTGNPNLRPEIGHNYELGYNKSFDNGANVYIGATYRYNTDDIQSLTTFATVLTIDGVNYSNVFLNQRFNIGKQLSEGVNLFGSLPLGKLNLRANVQLGERTNTSPTLGSVTGFAARTNLNTTYQFGHDLTAEAFVNYNSSQKNLQGMRPAFFAYNFAVRKQFLNKKASIGLTASDPFNEFTNQRSTTVGANFNQTYLRQVPFRTFGISLSYKFGKLEFKKEKEDNNNNDIQAPPDNGK
ncbi:MAG: Ferric enterobactin receptor precursor [Mucilaginibacter sp.]|nr:Ferric enterobactin receptor precursor [Mucilaginibacter sp.]